MKPLYTQIEFDAAKSREKMPLECEVCGTRFLRSKNEIQTGLSDASRNRNSCCSMKCVAHSKRDLSKDVVCLQCDKPFKKTPSQIKYTKHNFCCSSCAAKYCNAHKTKGTRCSKLEKWIQEQLPVLFPMIEFHFNKRDAIKAELDIFIPSLKLAFELNGIFHYEPIYGPEKLGRIQNNDERKMIACSELGIELCVVDTYFVSYFKPAKAQRYLDIIVNIINSKLSRISQLSLLSSQNPVEVP